MKSLAIQVLKLIEEGFGSTAQIKNAVEPLKDQISPVISAVAPDWKFTTKISYFSGGFSITINVKNWPEQVDFEDEDAPDINYVKDSSKFDKTMDKVDTVLRKHFSKMTKDLASLYIEFQNSAGSDLYNLDGNMG